MNYTAEELYELITSSKSCSYFAKTHVIKKPLTLLQLEAFEFDQRYNLGAVRQSYRTTALLTRALWSFCFNKSAHILFVTHRNDAAQDMRHKFLQMFESLPAYMQVKLLRHNRDVIESPDTRIQFRAATSTLGRGQTVDLLLMDNTSHWPKQLRDELNISLYPCLSSTSMLLEAQ
jgi:hypothetical protein